MSAPPRFPLARTVREAVRIQERLRRRIRLRPLNRRRIRLVAGIDVSNDLHSDRLFAGVVVLRWPGLEAVEERWDVSKARFPYVPGLLAFREIPAVLGAWRRLETRPDVVLCDAHGIAHPRRFGLACAMGLAVHTPSVGCAKRVLVGTYDEPGAARGSRSWLVEGVERIGLVLRTREGVQPVFTSPGHRSDFRSAARMVLDATAGFRVPEPIRRAHALVNAARRGELGPRPARRRVLE